MNLNTLLNRSPLDSEGTVAETIRDDWFSYLLILPTLVFIVGLFWYPFVRGIWMSLHEWNLNDTVYPFVGLDNYIFLFTWDPFWTAMKATLVFSTTTLIQLVLALVAALIVSNLSKFKSVVSGTFLLPYTMAPVVTGTVWLYLLNVNNGPIFLLLQNSGILDQPIYWAQNGPMSLAVITLVTGWTFWPFMFIILLASLENIPDEHYESAKVYGAGYLSRFRLVTLPQLKSAILVAFSIRMVWNLSKVSQPLQLTGGGPGYETSLLAILLYRFTSARGALGLSFAMGIILLILSLAFVILFIREFQKAESGGAA